MANAGCWVAYYVDWSGMAVFNSELKAMRYAVEKSMRVMFVPWGVDLREAANA